MLPESITHGFEVRRNVDGAPLAIGAWVRIDSALDATADARFAGRKGAVTGYVYDAPTEQYPHRPLVLVWVDGLGEDVFFVDELRTLAAQRQAMPAAA